TADLRKRILALYAELDADVATAGPRCESSGRCCRFAEYGHTLFISNLEAEVLLEAAPEYSRPVSASACPFPSGKPGTPREPRPLGCRGYFCDPSYQEIAQELSERYLRRLKALADEVGTQWQYAPLHYFLNESAGSSPAPIAETHPARIPLTITD